MGSIRVLLADDHAIVRGATAEAVDHQSDMQVVGQAGTDAEAIALACKLQPDVVVMDVAMPGVEGLRPRAASSPSAQPAGCWCSPPMRRSRPFSSCSRPARWAIYAVVDGLRLAAGVRLVPVRRS